MAAQDTIPDDGTAKIDEKRVKAIQQVVGGVLYYSRAVDSTVFLALSSIASEQASATKMTKKKAAQLLNYLATHSKAVVRYYASDMILNIHSDATYLPESRARSRIAGEFFMGSVPVNGRPIKLNGAIFIMCGILKCVLASAAEAELAALFVTA